MDGERSEKRRQSNDLGRSVLTEDLEVDGRVLLARLVLGDADVLGLVALVHLPDGQLGAVVAEDVFLVLLILYLLPVPAGTETGRTAILTTELRG